MVEMQVRLKSMTEDYFTVLRCEEEQNGGGCEMKLKGRQNKG